MRQNTKPPSIVFGEVHPSTEQPASADSLPVESVERIRREAKAGPRLSRLGVSNCPLQQQSRIRVPNNSHAAGAAAVERFTHVRVHAHPAAAQRAIVAAP